MEKLNQEKDIEIKIQLRNQPVQIHNSNEKPNQSDQLHVLQNDKIDQTQQVQNNYSAPYFNQWMTQQTTMHPSYYSYYPYPHDTYLNNYAFLPPYPNQTNNKLQENFVLGKTTDTFSQSPFFAQVTPPPFPHPLHNPYHYQYSYPPIHRQSHLNQDEEQLQQSDLSPIVKFQQQSRPNTAQERRLKQKKLKRKIKNETKNIPKNYGKAMISFILSHLDWIQQQFGIQKRDDLISQLKRRKNSINAIVHLKELWTTSKYAKQFRILSGLFLRKYSFAYIFNSRVSNYSTHIKYKYKLQEALKSPGNFSRIKQF